MLDVTATAADSAMGVDVSANPTNMPDLDTAGKQSKKPRKNNTQAERLNNWRAFRDAYLDELLRFEGTGTATGCIPTCSKHACLPLHRIQRFNGKFYEHTTLRDAGQIIQLGHDGGPCSHPGRQCRTFVVVDTSGFHEVHLRFCSCLHEEGFISTWAQLLRVGWFPASGERPSTAFTFNVLNFFHQLNHQAKTNLHDFQQTLNHVTDNSGIRSWDRSRPFSDVRGGQGHDPDGVDATQEGALAVECPACPQPDRNLPDDWQSAAEVWLYTLFLMVDANFRLRLKDRGFNDTHLSSGWAYYVNEEKFQTHLTTHHATFGDHNENSTCSAEHKAIINANLKKDGYIASGVAAILCARHMLVRPRGVGDLQKGESKNFNKRISDFPPHMQIDFDQIVLRWGIPKKHIAVHGPNHSKFSFNYLPNVGRTYGEGIESSWSHMNPVAMSTREMGSGARHETLDDHWGAWNWSKIVNFGPHFARSLKRAHDMSIKHQAIFEEYTATFKPEMIAQWTKLMDEWKQHPGIQPDPFEAPELKLEEQQAILIARSKGRKTATELATLHEKHTLHSRRIELWRKIQEVYMPIVGSLLAQ
ncbi:hypothetical protein K474DRAFT_1680807, partial [Panus rudis PR-1116 ss-1]